MQKKRQILNTGFRLVAMLKFLYEESASKAELTERFKKEYPFIKDFSGETMKLDINSLLRAGFKIGRRHTVPIRRLYLKESPIKYKFSEMDCRLFLMVKDAAFEILSAEEIIKLREFFIGIKDFLQEDMKDEILDFGFLALIDETILKMAFSAIEAKKYCQITYNSQPSEIKNLECFPIKIIVRNAKFYLRCRTKKQDELATFRMDNILNIENIETEEKLKTKKEEENIVYTITKKYYDNFPIERFETPVKITPQEVELSVDIEDMFFAVQRILILGKNCISIKHPEVKKLVLQSLNETLEIYK